MNGLEQHMDLIDSHKVDYGSLLPLNYDFEYFNIPFSCQILRDEYENSYIINLTANIGYLPYSSENINQRQRMLKNFAHLLSHDLIIMDRHSHMTFPINTTMTGEINAKKVMETILYTILDVKEVLDIINETMQYKSIDNKSQ